MLWQKNYIVSVVTNQSGIAKGLYSSKRVIEIHQHMQKLFGDHGKIHWYFCPHRNEDLCECRKPKPGMLLQAIKEHQLDPQKTWLVGDAPRDMEAGKKAGCRTALVLSGLTCELKSNIADVVCKNLKEFVAKEIIEKS